MSVLDQLSSSLGRRDEEPNLALAKEIVHTQDKKAVNELVNHLSNTTAIQNDCIKVLYEIGEQKPELISDYLGVFVKLLSSKNNRLQWGAMTALAAITKEKPKEIYAALPGILDAADKGSVITRDQAVNILITLCTIEKYIDSAFKLLIEQILKSPTNQVPMYAERAFPIVNTQNKSLFIQTLTSRLGDIEKDSKRKRVEKLIQKLTK